MREAAIFPSVNQALFGPAFRCCFDLQRIVDYDRRVATPQSNEAYDSRHP
jgi:hypothetical protein